MPRLGYYRENTRPCTIDPSKTGGATSTEHCHHQLNNKAHHLSGRVLITWNHPLCHSPKNVCRSTVAASALPRVQALVHPASSPKRLVANGWTDATRDGNRLHSKRREIRNSAPFQPLSVVWHHGGFEFTFVVRTLLEHDRSSRESLNSHQRAKTLSITSQLYPIMRFRHSQSSFLNPDSSALHHGRRTPTLPLKITSPQGIQRLTQTSPNSPGAVKHF